MPALGTVAERLARNRYAPDEGHSHIEVDQAVARATGTGALLVRVCPAHVFSEAPDGSIAVQHVACLECGTCLAVAAPGALRWQHPRGGHGIAYREG
jgi:ferredoxin like protein